MKCAIKNLDDKKVGDVDLSSAVFGLPLRADILNRMVNWQRARRQAGTHKTRLIHEISGTTKKPWNQKGTGRARAGSLRIPHFRGGATMFGPQVRSHAHKLPKRVRTLALKTALSAKQAEGKLVVVDALKMTSAKTKDFTKKLEKLAWGKALVIDGAEVDHNFSRAASNVPNLDVLPQQGINVYDILRHDTLVLTKAAVAHLEERLGK
ncbi:MAG: 50S ribosomal protein L4 [bacterium]|nr:50S ribosomal protein L4 [bacterium]